MPIRITLDSAYIISLALGIVIIAASLTISWQQYQEIETSTSGVLEQIILTRLDIISLGEQHNAIVAGLRFNKTEQDNAPQTEYNDTQIKHLKLEAQALKTQMEITSKKLEDLEFLRDRIKSDMTLYVVLTVIGLVAGLLFIILGSFGWFYHVKVFQERRTVDRESVDSGDES